MLSRLWSQPSLGFITKSGDPPPPTPSFVCISKRTRHKRRYLLSSHQSSLTNLGAPENARKNNGEPQSTYRYICLARQKVSVLLDLELCILHRKNTAIHRSKANTKKKKIVATSNRSWTSSSHRTGMGVPLASGRRPADWGKAWELERGGLYTAHSTGRFLLVNNKHQLTTW